MNRVTLGLVALLVLLLGWAALREITASERARRWAAERDRFVDAAADFAKAQAAREDTIGRLMDSAEAGRATADSLTRVAEGLRRRLREVTAIVPADLPDTCRPVVGTLVEQLALRDSVLAFRDDEVAALRSADSAWNRTVAVFADRWIAEHQRRLDAEHLVTTAPIQRPPRLVVSGDALAGVTGGTLVRAGARVRLTGPLWLTGEQEWSHGVTTQRLGLRAEVRLW